MSIELFVLIVFLALACEYADSTFGMGYGTMMTPILILLGYSPLQLVPIVLISEMLTGLAAGFFHHKEGNINLKDEKNSKLIWMLSTYSVIGAVAAVLLAVKLPKFYVNLYIAILILSIGITVLVTQNMILKFSWRKIFVIGTLASFNKGISGGGFGPLLCTGQILSGIKPKAAIAITSLAESATCLVAIILYLLLAPSKIEWSLVFPILIGGLSSVPLSAKSVKLIPDKTFKKLIGIVTILLGTLLLIKVF